MPFKLLKSTLSRKNLMALTGLFLCFFLVIHLLGNLQLIAPQAKAAANFNNYSALLSGNIFIKVISYVLYIALIAHAIDGLVITIKNRRTDATYAYDQRKKTSKWYSRNMGVLGTILLLFLFIHFKDFWYTYKFGKLPYDAAGHKDLYLIVVNAFHSLWYVLGYTVAMFALGFHLLQGFKSACRTLGAFHPKYAQYLDTFGKIYSYTLTIGFTIIPFYIYFSQFL